MKDEWARKDELFTEITLSKEELFTEGNSWQAHSEAMSQEPGIPDSLTMVKEEIPWGVVSVLSPHQPSQEAHTLSPIII